MISITHLIKTKAAGYYLFTAFLITCVLSVQAQGEWRTNSAGRPVYILTNKPATPYKATPPGKYEQPEPEVSNKTVIRKPEIDPYVSFSDEEDENGFLIAKKDGKWGLVYKGTTIFYLKPTYDSIIAGGKGQFYAVKNDGKWSFINGKGDIKIAYRYDDVIRRFENGRAIVFWNGSRRVIDERGVWIEPWPSEIPLLSPPVESSIPTDLVLKPTPEGEFRFFDEKKNIKLKEPATKAEIFYKKGDSTIASISSPSTANERNKKWQQAIVFYTKAITLNPAETKYYNARALLKKNLKNYAAAILDFNAAIKIDPAFGLGYNNRGYTKLLAGDNKGACNDWHKAVEIGYAYSADFIKSYCK